MTRLESSPVRTALVAGVALGAFTVAVASLLPSGAALGLLAVILGLAVGAYLGSFAARDGRAGGAVELAVGLGFVVLAVLGLWLDPLFLAAGWLLHAAWDGLHHAGKVPSRIGAWVPPFCAAYDLIVAAYIVVRWLVP